MEVDLINPVFLSIFLFSLFIIIVIYRLLLFINLGEGLGGLVFYTWASLMGSGILLEIDDVSRIINLDEVSFLINFLYHSRSSGLLYWWNVNTCLYSNQCEAKI